MIATLVFVDVKPENIEEFRAITIYNHDNTRKEAGNVRFDVLQSKDDPTKFTLIEVFEDMRKNISDSSIMIISHQERILNIADEIIVLKDGKLEYMGPKDEILPKLNGTDSSIKGCGKGILKKEVE